MTYDVSEHLRVGTIVTDGDPSGLTDNRLFGADVVWQFGHAIEKADGDAYGGPVGGVAFFVAEQADFAERKLGLLRDLGVLCGQTGLCRGVARS